MSSVFPKVPQGTTHEYLIAQAQFYEKNGHIDYLIDGSTGEKTEYKNVEIKTRNIASYLYKKGLRKGDVVIYLTSYQIHQIPLMIGVWRANAIIRSIYVDESIDTIVEKVKDTNCRWIFCDAENGKLCKTIEQKCGWPVEVIICGGELNGFRNITDLYNDSGDKCPDTEVTGEDIALMLPTSGTTGSSKGAAFPHKSLIFNIRNFAVLPLHKAKPNLIASKGTHISGSILPLAILVRGACGLVLPKSSKKIIIKTVDKYKPGMIFAFPTFLHALGTSDADGYDVTSIETIFTGGSPATEEHIKSYKRISSNVKDVIIIYGLTEVGGVCISSDANKTAPSYTYDGYPCGSVGKPQGAIIEIRDPQTLQTVGTNTRGELCIKGESVFKEYFKDPENTKKAFTEDGFFRTGDIAYVDENGFIFVVDRLKDIFKYFHNHISPTEIEGVVAGHPEVKETCVIAIPDEAGHVPRAFVSLRNPKDHPDKQAIADEIKNFANEKLASYKQLRGGLYILDEFPKGKTGKVDRNRIAEIKV